MMNIKFDDARDAANIAKHGIPLALGAVVLENAVGQLVDDRQNYGEIDRIIPVYKASRQEQRVWPS